MDPSPPPLAAVPPRPRRLVFLGTPEIAVRPLEALVQGGWDVALAVTRADARRGRGGARSASPVKAAATALGVAVTHRLDDAVEVGADLGVVVAYGRLVPRRVLERLPMLNLHFSLLPRWRGAAPVERALLAGDPVTGVCLMQLDEGLDTGPLFGRRVVPVPARATADDLRAALVAEGTDLLCTSLRDGFGLAVPQEGEATYAAKIEPADLHLDWEDAADVLDRVVRVGGAWTTLAGRRLKVHAAEPDARPVPPGLVTTADGQVVVGAGRGSLRLVAVQPEGKAVMPATAWHHGLRGHGEVRLGS